MARPVGFAKGRGEWQEYHGLRKASDRASLPHQVDGLEARLRSEQWSGMHSAVTASGDAASGAVDDWEYTHGALIGALKTLGAAGAVIGVVVCPWTAPYAMPALTTLLAVGTAKAIDTRFLAGQTPSQIATGALADVTGVNNLTLGIWGIDAGTGQTIPLTPNQQGQYFGAGVASITVSIAAAGASQPPTTITIPNPRNLLPPPAVVIPSVGVISIPAAPPIPIPLPIANLTTATVTIAGTNFIIMMSTGTNGGGGPAVPAGGNGNPTQPPSSGAPNAIVPQKTRDTLGTVNQTGAAPSGYRGGATFANDGRGGGQVLPTTKPDGSSITYKEYDVNPYTPGVNRGPERLVVGSDGRAYYTNDHYTTFTEF